MRSKTEKLQSTTAGDLALGGTAGAGGGTVVILLSKALFQDGSLEQTLLVYLAPSISVAISALSLWVSRKVKSGIALMQLKRQVRQGRAELQRLRQTIPASSFSTAHIEELEGYIQELEKAYFAAIRDLGMKTAKDVYCSGRTPSETDLK